MFTRMGDETVFWSRSDVLHDELAGMKHPASFSVGYVYSQHWCSNAWRRSSQWEVLSRQDFAIQRIGSRINIDIF